MKFVVFVEGHTEQSALPAFLHRAVNARLSTRVGVDIVRFKGWGNYEKQVSEAVRRQLTRPTGKKLIAVIGLIDFYGPRFLPSREGVAERAAIGKAHIESLVNDDNFRHHFAVHETEAWLLADPAIHDRRVRASLSRYATHPEAVNDENPPSRVLEAIYRQHLKQRYQKRLHGGRLFQALDPDKVYACCPHFSRLIDDMIVLAEAALA